MIILEVDISCHNQFCIELKDCSTELRNFLVSETVLIPNHSYSKLKDLILRRKARPFLQGEGQNFLQQGAEKRHWILIEFWTDDLDAIQEWVDYLNAQINLLNIK